MYQHILIAVALDVEKDPDKSLEVAKLLATKATRVTVLHVKEEIPAYAIAYMPKNYEIGLHDAIRSQLKELAQGFENGRAELVHGHSGRTILEWADEHAVDCIILNSHQPSFEDYILGSTAARVVRHAKCSVHVIR
ncbi:universal stress protein [Pseudorhodobacter sp. W20_MBD10_FR17]|uniref:universal stress protein n=1 Tax=Pseudorhodobacter sp. W20_MBD10_FR17 TaxID=3240266 RepID=UPI003F97B158